MHRKCTLLLFCMISILLGGCATGEEIAYKKATQSEDIEYLSDFIRNHPQHPKLEDVQYRLRVYEYRYVKHGKDPILMRYFIQRYRRGGDVKQIRKLLFKLQFNGGKHLADFRRMKRFFGEDQYQEKINEKIYILRSIEIKKTKDQEVMKQFIKDYPRTELSVQLEQKLLENELALLVQKKDIKAIEHFLNRHPLLRTPKLVEQLSFLRLKQYRHESLESLERYIHNNPKDVNRAEFDKLLIKRRYQHYIAFYKMKELQNLYKTTPLEIFKKEIDWFEQNSPQVMVAQKILKEIITPYKISFKEKMNFYEISDNTLRECDMILKMPFFISDLEPYLKKSESRFQIVQVATLLALEGYYNRNRVENRKKIELKLQFLKKLPQKPLILKRRAFLYFTLGDEQNLKSVLIRLMAQTPRDLMIHIMGHKMVEKDSVQLIKLMLDHARDHDLAINSQKTVYKNKVDHYQELFWIDQWLTELIKERKGKAISPGLNHKIEQIRSYTQKIKGDANPFEFWLDLEAKGLKNVKDLQKIRAIESSLKESIYYNLPFNRVRELLGGGGWFKKQNLIFSTYLKGKR